MSTWIFLRGLTRESRHWGDFPETFRQEIADADVVTIDLPGNGRLHKMNSPTSVEEMSAYCREELTKRNLRKPYSVLAMSLGAMVATAWATNYPQEIDACVLINTSMRPISPFYRRLKPRNYFALSKLLLGGDDSEWESTVLRITSRRFASSAIVLNNWISYRREHPVSRSNAMRQLLAAARFHASVIKPLPRILIMASTQDALVDVRCSRQLASRWNAQLVEHPSAGHDIPLDEGLWVAQQVGIWLQSTQKFRE